MRKLMWFSIGFGAACALCVYLISVAVALLLGIGATLIGFALYFLREGRKTKICACLCFGLAAGIAIFCTHSALRYAPAKAVDGQTVQLIAEAVDFSFDSDYGITVDGKTEISGVTYRIRMYLHQKEPLSPGDRITGQFRLRYTAPGGKETPTSHSGNGILLLAYPKGEHSIQKAEAMHVRYVPAYLRMHLTRLLEKVFPVDAVPFAKALLLGDTSDLSYETKTDLSLSGIRHVAAVSGLHVSILFSVVYLFVGKKSWLTAVIGIPVLILFAAVAGFSPSILRAGLMQLLMLLAILLRKEYDPPTALAFATLAMLSADPMTISSVGFQLSVASVAGIFLFCGRINGWIMDVKRLGRWKKTKIDRLISTFSSSISVSLSALLLTTPLTAWYFGSVSLIGPLTNLLCLWVVTILFCGIIGTCVLGVIWLPLGKLAGSLLSWLVRYILGVSGITARLPMACVYTQSVYIVAWLVFAYILLAVFLLSKQKRPVILGCCAALSLCVALTASWVEPLLDNYRLTVLDVGQGQCVLLQSDGRTYMVDCGGSYDEETADIAAATLLSQGITRLDGLILTHYDTDHVGGAGYLLHRINTDILVLPEGDGAEIWDGKILENHAGATVRAEEDVQIRWADSVITVYSGWNAESGNESSLCILFQTEKCDILITGDRSTVGEEILLMQTQLPQLDALVVGHHGAGTSTGEALLAATNPGVALISVGEGNRYNHPSAQTLERLIACGCRIRRTDLEGTIIFRG